MIIAIDFREAARTKPAGKGRLVLEVVKAMLPLLDNSTHFLLLTKKNQKIHHLPAGNWTQKALPGKGPLWHIVVIFWLNVLRPCNLYFSTLSLATPAFIWTVPVVTILYDFTTWHYPGTHHRLAVVLEKIFTKASCLVSKHLISISEFTKQEAIDLLGVKPTKISTILLAAGPEFESAPLEVERKKELQKKYQLPEEFILYLGTLEPRKNLKVLIAAYSRIQANYPNLHLALAGAKGWNLGSILKRLPERVELLGYVDEADKADLYKMAKVFVFPSVYEGFGLPPLEAMASGTPVISSNAASLPEVVGDAALTFNPGHADELAEALEEIVTNQALRSKLRKAGIARSQLFSWKVTAQATLTVLKRYV